VRAVEIVEGNWPLGALTALVRFPDETSLRTFWNSPENARTKNLRHSTATRHVACHYGLGTRSSRPDEHCCERTVVPAITNYEDVNRKGACLMPCAPQISRIALKTKRILLEGSPEVSMPTFRAGDAMIEDNGQDLQVSPGFGCRSR
jgi:hypothetical protein